MRESKGHKEKPREDKGFSTSFAPIDFKRRDEARGNGGIVAACVALLRRGIAEIAAVRSSPRLGREEERK